MFKIKFTNQILLRHAINWLILAVLLQFIKELSFSLTIIVFRTLIEILIYMITYYAYALYSARYYKLDIGKYLISVLINLFFFLGSYYLLEFGLSAFLNDERLVLPSLNWILHAPVYFILIILLASSFYGNQKSIADLNSEIENEKTSIKQEILFFKNQFNDHISFNFLNYCYRYFLNKDTNGTKAIEIYSEMLRGTLEIESSESIALEKELQYIDQFIQLQKLVGKHTPVVFEKYGVFKNHQILPRILINYIENAYKYGVSNDELKPIKIKIEQIENILYFYISNFKKKDNSFIQSTKTGNINTKQQLDLYYQNSYSLLINDGEFTYNCNLKIKLQSI
jgi:hypothetical protein